MGAELIVPGDGGPLSASEITSDLGTSTGTANALAVAPAGDATTTFETNKLYWVKANLANTEATTLAKNGGSAVAIRKNPNNAALVGGEIAANGLLLLRYDGTYLQLVAGRSLAITDIASLTTALDQRLSRIPPLTTGSGLNYILTDASLGTPADGDIFAFRVHSNSSISADMAVNGGAAVPLKTLDNSGLPQSIGASQLQPKSTIIARYSSVNNSYIIIAGHVLTSGNIPNTLGATTFSGDVTLAGNLIRGNSTGSTSISGNSVVGTDKPEVSVYGSAHTSSPGAIEFKAGAVTRASNGTWTAIFSLAKGAYHGDFYLSDSLGDGHARYPVNGTTLGTVVDNASGITWVDAGSVGASNVGLRINSGNVEINVGTSVTASTKFAIRFEGTVV